MALSQSYMIPSFFDGVIPSVMYECPKCGGSSARLEYTRQDVYLRCLCGLMQLVSTTIKDMVIEHTDSGKEISLPRNNTKLWRCYMMLNGLMEATTQEITDRLNRRGPNTLTVSDVASQLTVLRYKGLVVSVDKKRGVVGGSTWQLTDAAKKLSGG